MRATGRRPRRLIAVALAAITLLSVAAAPVAADHAEVEVEQDDDGTALVTVETDDGTAENASVEVAVDDENATYDGVGEYTADENGTVDLPAPNGTVNVTVTATVGNETVSESATLGDDPDAFGLEVRDFVFSLNETDGPPGLTISAFVVENNPGDAPDDAGPPSVADVLNGTGPPTEAGPPADAGPSEDAGPDGDSEDDEGDDENEDDGDDEDEDAGPPEDAGQSGSE